MIFDQRNPTEISVENALFGGVRLLVVVSQFLFRLRSRWLLMASGCNDRAASRHGYTVCCTTPAVATVLPTVLYHVKKLVRGDVVDSYHSL